MKKFIILHKDRDATYQYFLSPHNDEYVLTIMYYDKIGNWRKGDEIILKMKVMHIFAPSEEIAIARANDWVKVNLGPNFEVKESVEV